MDIEAELDWLESGGQDSDLARPLPAAPVATRPIPLPEPQAVSETEVEPPVRENVMHTDADFERMPVN